MAVIEIYDNRVTQRKRRFVGKLGNLNYNIQQYFGV